MPPVPEQRDLLIEVGTEELPPRALRKLSEAFAKGLSAELTAKNLRHGNIQRFATPRRLAVLVRDLHANQPDQVLERRGPSLAAAYDQDGRPTKAAQGFARSCGVDLDALETRNTDQGAWLYYRSSRPGLPAGALLPAMVGTTLAKLPIPKRMRWGAGEAEFVRPVHWLVLLFGDEVLRTEILGVQTDRQTRGHRYHHPEPLTIGAPADYAALLENDGKVIADFDLRRARICQQVEGLASSLGGEARLDDDLLDEVTALVEWPQALAGSFDASFLDIPPEVLITTMQDNQRYFPVISQGRLLPHFIAISNIESADPDAVRAGNERVIRPRFIDAAFFWAQDRKVSLESRRAALETVVFQQQLGTLLDKSRRVEELAASLAEQLCVDVAHARRAAALAKCDLLTQMVFEFPTLQGVMGRYYAAGDGEPEAVSVALDEQYMPRHAGDALPQTGVGQVLALAERLDTLVGIFAIGHRPTGEKDPFGLRRAALGVLRIIIERALDLDLEAMLQRAAEGLADRLDATAAVPETLEYVMERLRTYYLDRDIAPDVINAVMARQPTRPLDFDRRVRAVQAFRRLPEAESLASANKRISNILRQSGLAATSLDEQLLRDDAERELHGRVQRLSREVEPLFEMGKYEQALAHLAALRQPVDRFFDEVLVMADDEALKRNRIALLDRLGSLFLRVADLSRLQ
jgi:glycyl-tRNA synthetase beta chain